MRKAGRRPPPAPGSLRSGPGSAWWVSSTSLGAPPFRVASCPRAGQSVQAGVDPLGERGVDAFHSRDLLGAGGLQSAKSAEMPQQVSASARSDAGNVLQAACIPRLLPAPAVACDRETVRFVANLLNQLQARRFRPRPDVPAVGKQQRFMPGTACLAL